MPVPNAFIYCLISEGISLPPPLSLSHTHICHTGGHTTLSVTSPNSPLPLQSLKVELTDAFSAPSQLSLDALPTGQMPAYETNPVYSGKGGSSRHWGIN